MSAHSVQSVNLGVSISLYYFGADVSACAAFALHAGHIPSFIWQAGNVPPHTLHTIGLHAIAIEN
jgi:hypothetical protein